MSEPRFTALPVHDFTVSNVVQSQNDLCRICGCTEMGHDNLVALARAAQEGEEIWRRNAQAGE